MGRVLNRRVLLTIVALVVAAIVLPPFINVNRFKPRIAGALSRSLGRPVSIGDVHLRLFPTPGLSMSRVVVEDDPAYSEEPLLRADEVTASLRLLSLWSGRLEIARLSFQYPSLNLVRRADGHWNLETLLERARQTPVAPTAKRIKDERLRFPYIESNSGRVNLKFGHEKTVYALSDADFALWLASEDEWNLRLSARPIRTDANLGDTGTLKVQGKVHRGTSLSETPLLLQITLQGAQLGQLSTLIYGRDRGWRGTVFFGMALDGTPAKLGVKVDTSVDDFRRYDIATRGNTSLAASCSAGFSSKTQTLSDINCAGPIGNGRVEARGTMAGLLPVRSYELSVTARELPAAELAALFRHMKKDLPEDVSAEGSVSAQFAVKRAEQGEPEWSGMGLATGFALQSSRLQEPLTIGDLRFGLPTTAAKVKAVKGYPIGPAAPQDALVVGPFAVDLGGATPAHAQGFFSRAGYRISLNGDTGLKRLLQVSEAMGVAAARFAPEGTAVVDLSVAGEWAGFAQPLVLGSAKIKATATISGINAPVQINSATIKLAENGISVQDLSFGWPKAGVTAAGSLQLPRRCTTIETCPVQFELRSESVAIEDLNALLNPQAAKRPWYAIMNAGITKQPMLARVSASGTVGIDTMKVRGVAAKNVSGSVTLEHGLLTVKNLTAAALGGKLSGSLRANFDVGPPAYEASGKLEGGSVAALSGPLRQSWGTGKLNATFAFTATGMDTATLTKSASGNINYTWRNGTMALALDGGAGPLRILDFRGTATLRDNRLSFAPGRMETASGIYTVSGTASLDRQLGLTLARGKTPAFEITGTLEKPKVKPSVPQTQAQLHP
jgi:hypothetical protein